jgi:hypothetical protein
MGVAEEDFLGPLRMKREYLSLSATTPSLQGEGELKKGLYNHVIARRHSDAGTL